MSKDPLKDKDPLAYRVLLMMPSIYRLWGRLRSQHLAPWIKEWELEEMFAGTGGKGAADAAYQTAVDIELHTLEGTNFTVGGRYPAVMDINPAVEADVRVASRAFTGPLKDDRCETIAIALHARGEASVPLHRLTRALQHAR